MSYTPSDFLLKTSAQPRELTSGLDVDVLSVQSSTRGFEVQADNGNQLFPVMMPSTWVPAGARIDWHGFADKWKDSPSLGDIIHHSTGAYRSEVVNDLGPTELAEPPDQAGPAEAELQGSFEASPQAGYFSFGSDITNIYPFRYIPPSDVDFPYWPGNVKGFTEGIPAQAPPLTTARQDAALGTYSHSYAGNFHGQAPAPSTLGRSGSPHFRSRFEPSDDAYNDYDFFPPNSSLNSSSLENVTARDYSASNRVTSALPEPVGIPVQDADRAVHSEQFSSSSQLAYTVDSQMSATIARLLGGNSPLVPGYGVLSLFESSGGSGANAEAPGFPLPVLSPQAGQSFAPRTTPIARHTFNKTAEARIAKLSSAAQNQIRNATLVRQFALDAKFQCLCGDMLPGDKKIVQRHVEDRHLVANPDEHVVCFWCPVPKDATKLKSIKKDDMGKHIRDVHFKSNSTWCSACDTFLARSDPSNFRRHLQDTCKGVSKIKKTRNA